MGTWKGLLLSITWTMVMSPFFQPGSAFGVSERNGTGMAISTFIFSLDLNAIVTTCPPCRKLAEAVDHTVLITTLFGSIKRNPPISFLLCLTTGMNYASNSPARHWGHVTTTHNSLDLNLQTKRIWEKELGLEAYHKHHDRLRRHLFIMTEGLSLKWSLSPSAFGFSWCKVRILSVLQMSRDV